MKSANYAERCIPPEVLRFLLTYDPNDGTLRWNEYVGGNSGRGNIAGCLSTHSKGYVTVSIFGRRYLAHILIWVIVTGEWPTLLVDHKDGVVTNNQWTNLRLATHSQSQINTKLRYDNVCGKRGVYRNRHGKWQASIAVNRKSYYLGVFDTVEEASEAYALKAKQLHGEFRREQ